ncbi:MAG: transketolase [Saprospiraceae bacterium]|nr:transketolase [Saprospiraceae bacterium]MDW8485181.1 transketolase [Saprospiraceae bacterium]
MTTDSLSFSPASHADLAQLALRVREHILRMSTDGGCFTGASLSCADLFVFLYTRFLRIGPDRLSDPERDYLLLSKGHDVPALYATLAELGWIPVERLKNHLKTNDFIYWHPNRHLPGVEFHSGSLGHLPAVGVGIALDIKLRCGQNRVVVVTGDGELDEGSVWEALLVASAYRLDNLVIVVDRNHFQANLPTEELIPLEPLAPKFEAFGCAVERISGHDFAQMEVTFSRLPFQTGKPSVIIADTIRGKGVPSIEARADRWFCNFTHEEVEALLGELRGEAQAHLTSETLTVR